jgi:hypothetical protein
MGLKPSPYWSVQGSGRAKRMMLGDPKDRANPFHWEKVVLNSPGSEDYDPSMPWFYKVRADGRRAVELFTYVDDVRITAPDSELAWLASSWVAKICSWLGLQDAARKRREPSQEPGAWAGAVVSTRGEACKSVSQDRWVKTRQQVRWIAAHAGVKTEDELVSQVPEDEDQGIPPAGKMPHKQLERYRGYLVYVSRTFPSFVPYLKGIHLTLDHWREDRDEDGWRTTNMPDRRVEVEGRAKPPRFTPIAIRLASDVEALLQLTEVADPPNIPVRPSQLAAAYIYGDASGTGYGSMLWVAGYGYIDVEYGAWDEEVADQSSNFREAFSEGLIGRGSEIWIFTDNSVSERAFHKGSSKSPLLHELCVRLRKLELEFGVFVRVIWVAGTRMIEQGTDGLSRGDLTGGVMSGKPFLEYVPLAQTIRERSPKLHRWLDSLMPGNWQWLDPADWCHEAFGNPTGRYIWDVVPPCLAEIALEYLCEIKHIHPDSCHLFMCPMLYTGTWRKQMLKAADAAFSIPVGSSLWPANCHEPVQCALMLPLLSEPPFSVRGRTKWLAELDSSMRGVWRGYCPTQRSGVRKLWTRSWNGKREVPGRLAR